jgi:hypothetical protein
MNLSMNPNCERYEKGLQIINSLNILPPKSNKLKIRDNENNVKEHEYYNLSYLMRIHMMNRCDDWEKQLIVFVDEFNKNHIADSIYRDVRVAKKLYPKDCVAKKLLKDKLFELGYETLQDLDVTDDDVWMFRFW